MRPRRLTAANTPPMSRTDDSFDPDTFYDGPSKTQIKKDMLVLQTLGEALAALPAENFAALKIDDRLREIGYGHWEGLTLPQMEVANPDAFALRQADKWGAAPPGGESYASVTLRMRDWYDFLLGDTVAVAHGGTARALMVALDLATSDSAANLTIEQGAVYVFSESGLAKYS